MYHFYPVLRNHITYFRIRILLFFLMWIRLSLNGDPDSGAESRGAEIKLPPGAGAEITNCGSSSGSDRLEEILFKKIMVAEEVFVNVTILILLLSQKR